MRSLAKFQWITTKLKKKPCIVKFLRIVFDMESLRTWKRRLCKPALYRLPTDHAKSGVSTLYTALTSGTSFIHLYISCRPNRFIDTIFIDFFSAFFYINLPAVGTMTPTGHVSVTHVRLFGDGRVRKCRKHKTHKIGKHRTCGNCTPIAYVVGSVVRFLNKFKRGGENENRTQN